jgi:hypothetical protein
MGDDLIDAPILTPGTGGYGKINSGKLIFVLSDNTEFDTAPTPFILYLRVIVSGTDHIVSFDSTTTITFGDIISQLNTSLAGIAISTYEYNSTLSLSYITVTSVATGADTYVTLIDGLDDGYGGTQFGTGLIAYGLHMYGSKGYSTNISPNSIHGTDTLYNNYVDEYYIVGALPANTPSIQPAFVYQFSYPITTSTPTSWIGATGWIETTLVTTINYNCIRSLVSMDHTVITTLGDLVSAINSQQTACTCTIDTSLNRLIITMNNDYSLFTETPPSLVVNSTITTSTDLWWALNTYTDAAGFYLLATDTAILGTPTTFQPGLWAKTAFAPGNLVVYDKNGRWKSLGNAADILSGKRVGIALRPQSGNKASGTFDGKDGQIAVYTA